MQPITQSGPYMPKSDTGKRAWMEAFIRSFAEYREQFGIDDRMWEYYQRTVKRFAEALAIARNPATGTPDEVRAKNDARKEAVAICRALAMMVKHDPGMTAPDKIKLGLHVDEENLTPVKLPKGILLSTGFPRLYLDALPTGGHRIRYGQDAHTGSRAKPKGVTHMLLVAAIGDRPNMEVRYARLMGAHTRWPIELNYPAGAGVEGLHATYYGRWLTSRGEIGPWSPGVSMIIARECVAMEQVSFAHIFGFGQPAALPSGDVCERALPEGVEPKRLPHSERYVITQMRGEVGGLLGDGNARLEQMEEVRLLREVA
jgi:hypothetical protein